MPGRLPHWTVLLIPQTHKRPIRFQLPTIVPTMVVLVLALFLVSATAAAVVWSHTYNVMQARIKELAHLETINTEQRREIETMTQKARETDELLERLRALEQDIQKILNANNETTQPAGTGQVTTTQPNGRGGRSQDPASNLPVLSAMIPPEARDILFSRRRVEVVASRGESRSPQSVGGSLQQAAAVTQLMDAQAREADQRVRNLAESKNALIDKIEFLAHRPTGFPVAGRVTDSFGLRWSPFGWGRQHHYGIDIAGSYWDPIVATGNGTVVFAGWKSGGYGYTVIVDHGYGYRTLYAHMVDYEVEVGDTVTRGQVVGYVGSSGLSTGPHVHYEVHRNGVEVDPTQYAQ